MLGSFGAVAGDFASVKPVKRSVSKTKTEVILNMVRIVCAISCGLKELCYTLNMQLTNRSIHFVQLLTPGVALAFFIALTPFSHADEHDGGLSVFQKSQDRGLEFRPTVGMQWYSIDGKKISGSKMRAGWMGAKASAELALIRLPVFESGVEGSLFKSQSPLSSDAQNVNVTDIAADAYVQLKANSTAMGIPMLKVSTGYGSFQRNASPPVADQMLPNLSGFRLGAQLSTYVDNIFTVGAETDYTFAADGVWEINGFLKHRLFTFKQSVWDFKFSTGVARMRIPMNQATYEENWTTVFLGLSVAI